jgi:eukaryotic-like serine/threonine-protein kinase
MGLFKKKVDGLPKARKRSVFYGFLIFLGAFISLIAILAVIKVTHYATYKNTQHHFQMKYPTYWSIIPRPKEAGLVIFLAPKITAMDMFPPNVNVTKQPLSDSKLTNFDDFSKEAVRQVVGLFEGYIDVIESRQIVAAGRRAYRFIHSGKSEGGKDPMCLMHVWFFVDNDAYIITYAASKSNFNRYLRTVNTMINSFSTF